MGLGALINKRLTTNTTFREVAATATTHKAASVLSKQIDFPVTTIHSFLGLVVRDNYATGTQFLNKETETENDHVGLLIIDEASMIDANLLKHILEAQDVDGFSILFVGDNCQLPPVEDDPLLFDEFSHVKHTLTKIHRQGAKNPIIQLANGYRDVILGTTSTYPEVKTARSDEGKTEGVFVVDESKFQDLITQACQSGSDYTGRYKILAFRNEVVNRFNSFAREACYKNRAVEASVFVGERFVVNSPVVKDTAVVLRNEEDVTVLRADKDNVLHGVRHTIVHVSPSHVPEYEQRANPVVCRVPYDWREVEAAVAPHRARATELARKIKKLKGDATKFNLVKALDQKRRDAWGEFFQIKREFADIRPPFSSTVHKSHGSTFETVFIDFGDLMRCRDTDVRDRLIYTAITRASKRVLINGGL